MLTTIHTMTYHLEIYQINGPGRVQYLRAAQTYSEAMEALRTLVKALNWNYYGCSVYLLIEGLPKYEARFVIENGKRRDLQID